MILFPNHIYNKFLCLLIATVFIFYIDIDAQPRPACKRPRLDLSIDDCDMSGLPWWFLDNLHDARSSGSTDILTDQVRPTDRSWRRDKAASNVILYRSLLTS